MCFNKTRIFKDYFRHLISAMLLTMTGVSAHAESIELEINATEINLEVHDADLLDIMELLSERADFDLWMSLYVSTKPLTLSIRSTTLESLLRKLLAEESHVLIMDSKASTPRVKGVFVLPTGTADAKLGSTVKHSSVSQQDKSQALEIGLNVQKLVDQINGLKLQPAVKNSNKPLTFSNNHGLPELVDQIEKLRTQATNHSLQLNQENSVPQDDPFTSKIQTLIDSLNSGIK